MLLESLINYFTPPHPSALMEFQNSIQEMEENGPRYLRKSDDSLTDRTAYVKSLNKLYQETLGDNSLILENDQILFEVEKIVLDNPDCSNDLLSLATDVYRAYSELELRAKTAKSNKELVSSLQIFKSEYQNFTSKLLPSNSALHSGPVKEQA